MNCINETLLTRKELCDYLNICLSCVDRLDIPKLKLGRSIRYRKSDVHEWLSKQVSNEEKSKSSVVTVRRSLTVTEEEPWP